MIKVARGFAPIVFCFRLFLSEPIQHMTLMEDGNSGLPEVVFKDVINFYYSFVL